MFDANTLGAEFTVFIRFPFVLLVNPDKHFPPLLKERSIWGQLFQILSLSPPPQTLDPYLLHLMVSLPPQAPLTQFWFCFVGFFNFLLSDRNFRERRVFQLLQFLFLQEWLPWLYLVLSCSVDSSFVLSSVPSNPVTTIHNQSIAVCGHFSLKVSEKGVISWLFPPMSPKTEVFPLFGFLGFLELSL